MRLLFRQQLGLIVFIDGKVNQDVYMSILDEYLVSFVEALNAYERINLKFQQNACLYKLKGQRRG